MKYSPKLKKILQNLMLFSSLTRLWYTDQPKKKALVSRFAPEHPLRENKKIAEKNKNHWFRRGFSSRDFAENLPEGSQRNSARFRRETPQNFAEILREISRWVGNHGMYGHNGEQCTCICKMFEISHVQYPPWTYSIKSLLFSKCGCFISNGSSF